MSFQLFFEGIIAQIPVAMLDDQNSLRNRQIERLIQISHMSAHAESQVLLQTIVEIGADLVHCEYCSILRYEPNEDALRFIAGPWLHMPVLAEMRVPAQHSIAGLVIKAGEPLVIHHAQNDPRIYRPLTDQLGLDVKSLLTVPLRYRDETLGVLQAVNKRSSGHQQAEFNHEDIAVLQSLAAHIAIAVTNERLSQENQALRAELLTLERMKKEFIAISNHELRSPLGLILGHGTYLRETSTENELKPQIDVIINSAIRLKEIIESLAHVENIDAGTARLRLSTFDLQQLIQTSANHFKDYARARDIDLDVQKHTQELLVEADYEKLVIVLNNLLHNALTFTEKGGSVMVSAEARIGYAQISVKDNGIGVPEAELDHIFERFYQVESHMTRHQGGMGLGLSVAKDLIELHGGQIVVDSQLDEGSTFTIIIPITQNP